MVITCIKNFIRCIDFLFSVIMYVVLRNVFIKALQYIPPSCAWDKKFVCFMQSLYRVFIGYFPRSYTGV